MVQGYPHLQQLGRGSVVTAGAHLGEALAAHQLAAHPALGGAGEEAEPGPHAEEADLQQHSVTMVTHGLHVCCTRPCSVLS